MHPDNTVLEGICRQKLLPLYYHDDVEVSIALLKALYDAGIRYVEYTNRGNHALPNFEAMRKVAEGMADLCLGVGTIKKMESAHDFIAAGAHFIIAPSINAEVGQVCAQAGVPWIPGCMTPTEIAVAENAGATLVKIFPGSLLGPGYITAIRELFPGMRYLVTGGVDTTEANLTAWFRAGVSGVGMGSKVLTKELVDQRNFAAITQQVRAALATVQHMGATGGSR